MTATYNGKMLVLAPSFLVALPSSKVELDSALTTEDVANGTRFTDGFVYAGAAKDTMTIDFPYSAGASGLVSTGTSPFIAKMVWPVGGVSFPQACIDKFKLSGKINSYLMGSTDLVNIGASTNGASGSGSGAVKPPLFQGLTVTTAVGSSTKCQSFDITYSNNLILVYENSGDPHPAEIIYGKVRVDFSIVLVSASDAEIAIVQAACQSGATMGFNIAAVCGSATFGAVVNNAYYTKVTRIGGKSAPTLDTITGFAFSPDGGSTAPLVLS